MQCLGAGQLPELQQVQETGSSTSGGLPLTGKYLFMAISSERKSHMSKLFECLALIGSQGFRSGQCSGEVQSGLT